jgi:benzoyl-CoA reductase subunit A
LKCTVGIDLGSTTTKAIVLDESGRIGGRGLTNSRSDYLVAARVAQSEAYINARLELLRGLLHTEQSKSAGAFLEDLRSRFKYEQIHEHFRHLRGLCLEEAATGRHAGAGRDLADAMTVILDRMQARLGEHIASFGEDDSVFFRDVASSLYMDIAGGVAAEAKVSFDLLVGIFDKAILAVENRLLDQSFRDCAQAALAALPPPAGNGLSAASVGEAVDYVAGVELEASSTIGTGYGRLSLPFEKDQIRSEILCHGLGAHYLFPGTRTVLDIGGQDMKAIQVDEQGIVDSFQMNDRCAAGTGRYLGYIADELNLGLHQLGPLASKAARPLRISSTCTVFAGTEFREKLALGHRRENILAGLHRAIVLRAMSLLARSGGVRQEFTFTGGVAKNGAAVKELRGLVAENYGESIVLNIHSDSIYTGAVGAALFALRREGRRDPGATSLGKGAAWA